MALSDTVTRQQLICDTGIHTNELYAKFVREAADWESTVIVQYARIVVIEV